MTPNVPTTVLNGRGWAVRWLTVDSEGWSAPPGQGAVLFVLDGAVRFDEPRERRAKVVSTPWNGRGATVDATHVLLIPNDAAFHLRAERGIASVLMVATGVPRAQGPVHDLPRVRPWPRETLVHHNEVLRIVVRSAGALRPGTPERDAVVLLLDTPAGGLGICPAGQPRALPRGSRWVELIEQRPQAGRGPVQPY